MEHNIFKQKDKKTILKQCHRILSPKKGFELICEANFQNLGNHRVGSELPVGWMSEKHFST